MVNWGRIGRWAAQQEIRRVLVLGVGGVEVRQISLARARWIVGPFRGRQADGRGGGGEDKRELARFEERRALKEVIEGLKQSVGDMAHGPSVRERDFQIPVVKHLKENIGHKTDQAKSGYGSSVMFEAVIKGIAIDQEIEPFILYLPPFMPDPTSRLGGRNGLGQSRAPVPV
jgi:hypothetical protein